MYKYDLCLKFYPKKTQFSHTKVCFVDFVSWLKFLLDTHTVTITVFTVMQPCYIMVSLCARLLLAFSVTYLFPSVSGTHRHIDSSELMCHRFHLEPLSTKTHVHTGPHTVQAIQTLEQNYSRFYPDLKLGLGYSFTVHWLLHSQFFDVL